MSANQRTHTPAPTQGTQADPAHELGRHPRDIPDASTTLAADQPWCPSCSAPLRGRSCKLRCLRCGYFEDCSNLL